MASPSPSQVTSTIANDASSAADSTQANNIIAYIDSILSDIVAQSNANPLLRLVNESASTQTISFRNNDNPVFKGLITVGTIALIKQNYTGVGWTTVTVEQNPSPTYPALSTFSVILVGPA